MKTAEEKAKEYSEKFNIYLEGMKVYPPIRDAFISGYNEAMRWRDPVNDPPKCNELMQIKYSDTFSNIISYEHDRYIEDAGMWDIEQSVNIQVLGWRPVK